MRLVNFEISGHAYTGIVEKENVYNITEALKPRSVLLSSVEELLTKYSLDEIEKLAKDSPSYALREVHLSPPIRNPEKIMLAAVNYKSHAKEGGFVKPAYPYLFSKYKNALVGPYDPIIKHSITSKMDYEGELAVVIGKKCKHVQTKSAMDCVAGYAIANDISYRDWQFSGNRGLGMDWIMGKSLDTGFPLGPWLITKDEISDPYSLNIKTFVNGEIRQNGSTADMIFTIEEIISHISKGITLMTGDIISTGTPEGVAAFSGEKYLKEGDVVKVEIASIGYIENKVVPEQ